MTKNIKFYPEDFAKLILFILFLFLAALATHAQVKPVNDTINFAQGISKNYNVLTNDVGNNLKVTSWKLRTTSYDTGKVVSMPGVGSITINGRGLLIYKNANDTFIGKLAEISYVANNTLSRGVSARVLINIAKRPPNKDTLTLPSVVKFYKTEHYGPVLDNGQVKFRGIVSCFDDGCKMHYYFLGDKLYWPIPKEIYDLLK